MRTVLHLTTTCALLLILFHSVPASFAQFEGTPDDAIIGDNDDPIAEPAPPAQQALSNRVLVIYNTIPSESLDVANHYMARRNIPVINKLGIAFSSEHEISWTEYTSSQVRGAITRKLDELGRSNILYIVFSYKTPYRVIGATITIPNVFPGDEGRGECDRKQSVARKKQVVLCCLKLLPTVSGHTRTRDFNRPIRC